MQRLSQGIWMLVFFTVFSITQFSITQLEQATAQIRVSPSWQELGDGPSNSSEVAEIVVDGTLHLVTVRDAGSAGQLYEYRTINPEGVISSPEVILSGWLGLSYPALIARADGSLSVLFFGNRSGDTSDPYSSYSLFRVSSTPDRSTWSLDSNVYDGAPGLGGQSANGAVLYNGTEEVGISIQGGDARAYNISTLTARQTSSRPCCAYSPTGAILPSSRELIIGFYSNATNQAGIFFQTLFPEIGALWQAPGAELDSRVRVPLVARGADLYTAYAYGSLSSGVRVWKLGDDAGAYIDIPNSKGAIGVTLASDGDHLWVVWGVADGTTTTYIARSNAAGTQFGRVFKVLGPPRSTAIYNRSVEAGRGHLDLFVTANGPAVGISSLYARIGIPLEVRARPARVSRSGGAVRLIVTDGDIPLAGVRLRGGGRTTRTNARGQARMVFGAGRTAIRISATKNGYTPGAVSIRRS